MRASEIVGGLSVIGVVALIGFAIAEDADPETVTTPTAPTILAPVDATTTAPAEPTPTEPASATDTTEVEGETTVATEPPPASTTTTTEAPPTTQAPPTLAPEDREVIRVRVVNAGGVAGAATFVTGVLEGEGFDPGSPADGVDNVEANTIIYAPGQELAAAAVNEFVDAPDVLVIEAPDDRNWEEFGSELDVLVVLGPA